MKDPELTKIVDKVNDHWQKLFDALQDLAEYLHEHGHDPDKEKQCDSVPLFRKVTG